MLLGRSLVKEAARRASCREIARALIFQVCDDRPQIDFGLRFGDARLQSSEQVNAANAFNDAPALERDRKIDVGDSRHINRFGMTPITVRTLSFKRSCPTTFGSPPNCRCSGSRAPPPGPRQLWRHPA